MMRDCMQSLLADSNSRGGADVDFTWTAADKIAADLPAECSFLKGIPAE